MSFICNCLKANVFCKNLKHQHDFCDILNSRKQQILIFNDIIKHDVLHPDTQSLAYRFKEYSVYPNVCLNTLFINSCN